jgi:peptide/nickel transport system substrate-binding protein
MDSGLGTGQYQVMAGDYLGIKTVSVTAGVETPGVDFTRNLAWIAGTVVNSTGGPIKSADLQAESDTTSASSSTDDKGKYTMEIDIPEGETSLVLTVTASQKGYDPSSKSVTVNSGQTSHEDFTLQSASGTLRGRVVAAYVAPPKQTATLSIQSSATSIGVGSPLTISGSLSATRSGIVTIYQSVNGSAFTTLTTVSMSNGAYTYSYTPSGLGTYQFKASWPGDDQYNSADSATVTVTVSTTPKQTATLSVQSSATTVNVGSAVTISGSISPSRSGSVTISLSVNGSAFTTLTTVSLSNGGYTYSYTPSSAGTYQFKASWPGDDQYNPAQSSTTTVTASTQQPTSACVIATATYGSELSPQVQLLRNFRENIALKTFAGSSFMTAFNAWYYSWSPPVAAAIAPDDAARATMRVVLQPILNILQIATATFTSLSFNSEFAIIMAGFIAASLIGLVYLMPITTVALVAINKLSRYKSLPRMGQLRILLVPWIASIILMLLGELSALSALMILATSAFVVTTILLVVGTTSLKIAKTLVKL